MTRPNDAEREALETVIELIYDIVGAPKDAPYGDLPGYVRDALSAVNDTPASEDIVTLRERVESAEYRAAEYQRINGLHNTELDSPREQLATAKAGLRVLQSESAASKNEEKSDG